jgi:hypothetical protein
MTEIDDDILIGVGRIAKFMKQCERTTSRLLNGGKLPGFRTGAKWMVSRKVLLEWMAEQCRANVKKRKP